MTPRLSAAAIAVLLSTALLTSCSDEGDPDSRRGIDARAYYTDYESGADDDSGGTVNYSSQPSTAEDAGGDEPPLPPRPDEDNFFRDHGTSGFVDTAADARSTFALDVDTGSYGVACNLLKEGYRVPKAGIRVEEWINAFPYDDPAPADADLGVTAETGLAPTLDDGTQLVRVGVSAREVTTADRPRANITLVVDRSGSMDIRERLGLVQSSLALLADRLNPDDTVSVVSFEDKARPILEPTPVSDTEAIVDAIEELKPGGSTNLEAGLRLGYEQARDAFDPEAVNLVVLASDGVANVGHTGPNSIVDTIQEEGADGIHLVTVGYGLGNYNDHLMEQLADLGDGFYAYVDNYQEAEQLFGEDLVTTLTPVAAEARTQVAFDPELVTSYRLVGYDNRAIADEDFTDASTDAGELGAGHHATALYEVRLAPGVESGAVIGTAAVRWTPVDTGGAEGGQREAVIDLVAADQADDAPPSYRLELAATVADLAQVLKQAAPYDDRAVTLDDLLARAQALADADVAGADDLVTVVEQAIAVR